MSKIQPLKDLFVAMKQKMASGIGSVHVAWTDILPFQFVLDELERLSTNYTGAGVYALRIISSQDPHFEAGKYFSVAKDNDGKLFPEATFSPNLTVSLSAQPGSDDTLFDYIEKHLPPTVVVELVEIARSTGVTIHPRKDK